MSRQNVRVTNKKSEMAHVAGVDDSELTVSTEVVKFESFNAKTTHVLLTVNDQGVRVSFDGNDPTTDKGHTLAASSQELWLKELAAAAKFIRDAGSDAKIYVTEVAHR